jgi:PKD repeat protein
MKNLFTIFAAAGILFLLPSTRAQEGSLVPCKAAFTVSLDSMTSFPFLYHFMDKSSGNINSWTWDFGDGNTSAEQNPSHQYESGGNYQICLTVRNTDNPDSCYDQLCHGIITQEYYSLGGLVYAGEHPLNNPVAEGDTGIASLYRVTENFVTFVEDHTFSDLGYYWFGFVLPGKYLVKISLTPGSKHYGQFFTTYSGDEVNWGQASAVPLESASNYDANIHLVPVQSLTAGAGSIRGYIKFEQEGEASLPLLEQTTVILADKNKVPLVYTFPDGSGYFHFDELPLDTYFLSADATGKPSTIVTVTLTESAPAAEGINLTIFGGTVFKIPEDARKDLAIARIYPNPVTDMLSAQVFSASYESLNIQIIDLTGKTYYSGSRVIPAGMTQLDIPVNPLPKGMYLLTIVPQGPSHPVTVKFVR